MRAMMRGLIISRARHILVEVPVVMIELSYQGQSGERLETPAVLQYASSLLGTACLQIWSTGIQNSAALHALHNIATEATPCLSSRREGRIRPSPVIH